MAFYDLSHVIEAGMMTYKGLPAPVVCDYMSREGSRDRYEVGTEFQIDSIQMVGNTGTYLDSPFHRYSNGADLSELSLKSLANLPGVVVRVPSNRLEVTISDLAGLPLEGRAVLVCTGWDRYWRSETYFENHPFVTAEAAEYLVKSRAALVGIDSHNIDDTRGRSRPAHSLLLGAGIPICEHMTKLDGLPWEFRFFAVPPKFRKVGTLPVRAFAIRCVP